MRRRKRRAGNSPSAFLAGQRNCHLPKQTSCDFPSWKNKSPIPYRVWQVSMRGHSSPPLSFDSATATVVYILSLFPPWGLCTYDSYHLGSSSLRFLSWPLILVTQNSVFMTPPYAFFNHPGTMVYFNFLILLWFPDFLLLLLAFFFFFFAGRGWWCGNLLYKM
jgi:hypothetical protein